MRRDPRPFVVEVRRGPKKSPSAPAPSPFADPFTERPTSTDDDLMRRAEEALFGKPEPMRDTAPGAESAPQGGDSQPLRRILEAIVPETEPVEAPIPLAPEPARRGRKPGSKNRPKEVIDAAPGEKRRRGRPRKHPEGSVRSVEVTPELASAALEIMARAVPPPAPPTPVPVALERPPAFAPAEPKRPRGRPRKHPLPAVVPAEEAPLPSLAPGSMSATRIVNRYGSDDVTPAGRRWTRRLRSYANPEHVGRRLSRP